MTEKIRAAIAELKNRPWTAATYDMCQLDVGYETFVRTAKDKIYEPSIVVTSARNFETLMPKCLHHSPAFVIWLPPQLEYVTYVLPQVTPKAREHTSIDLRKRDLVVSWTCVGMSFLATMSALKASIAKQAQEGAMPLIIASETHTAVSVLLLDADFLEELTRAGNRCGEHYRPEQEYAPEVLEAAMKRKWARRTLADECIFQELRESDVVLRPRRAFRPDWIV
jgi:hypothetical protein